MPRTKNSDEGGYVRVPAARLAALEAQEAQLHELKLQLQRQDAARMNAEYLQDQLIPSQETALELITSASRTGEFKANQNQKHQQLRDITENELNDAEPPERAFTPPQSLDDLLPDAERDDADDVLAALEAMSPDEASTKLRKIMPQPLMTAEQQLELERNKYRTQAERDLHTEVMRPLDYGGIFATVIEMIGRNGDVVLQTKLLSPQNVQTVMQGIENGMSRKGACALVGITQATFARYKRLSDEEEPQEPFASFMQLLEMAEARSEAVLVGRWQRHTAGSWQASKALLEKRFRNEWGDRQQVELNLKQLMSLSPEQLLEVMGPEARAQVLEMEANDEGKFTT